MQDNKPINVYAGLAIIATKTEDGVDSIMLVNQGDQHDEFGLDYVAPQRVWSSTLNIIRINHNDPLGEITANIDEFGNPSGVQIVPDDAASLLDKNFFVNYIEKSCFVPGFAEGTNIALPYKETIGAF